MTDLRPTDDLDRGLAALHADVDTDLARIERTRSTLLDAVAHAPVRQRAPRRRWLLAAAAALALVAGGSIYLTTLAGGSAEAKSSLEGAAQQITSVSDPVVPPGQYRYLGSHTWTYGFTEIPGGGLEYLEEHTTETWIPANIRGTWYRRETTTGRHQWIKGSDELAKKYGITFDRKSTTTHAACGAFDGGGGACAADGSWQDPSLAWLSGLPKDPDALYERLKQDAPRNERGETELLVYAQDALRTGMLPADTRATLYRALGDLDDLQITDKAANLDGRIGIAYSSDDGSNREEIVIDPHTGAYIGSRQVSTNGPTRGRIEAYTSFINSVAPAPWKAPSK
ncbi:hypothetical protein GCM10009804_58260 [Kribbella hippodromi]|uniref:CU044_5270 family protein n=1 Tax=Kribbella hippodromi TaxID=434347 RepID=A0ABN2E2P5_9ACTN